MCSVVYCSTQCSSPVCQFVIALVCCSMERLAQGKPYWLELLPKRAAWTSSALRYECMLLFPYLHPLKRLKASYLLQINKKILQILKNASNSRCNVLEIAFKSKKKIWGKHMARSLLVLVTAVSLLLLVLFTPLHGWVYTRRFQGNYECVHSEEILFKTANLVKQNLNITSKGMSYAHKKDELSWLTWLIQLFSVFLQGPELLSKYIGASEQAVRDVFQRFVSKSSITFSWLVIPQITLFNF